MIRILVNNTWVETFASQGSPALDFIRGEMGLKGTKEGCREGDCGACAILVGEIGAQAPVYKALPSCLLALGELSGKHLVTIEGLGDSASDDAAKKSAGAPYDGLTPVMRAFLEENASQCGFCTPGFIISLTAWLCAPGPKNIAGAMAAVDGNLCRCTGYGSIRRAALRLVREFTSLPEQGMRRLEALVGAGVLPSSVLTFATVSAEDAGNTGMDAGGVSTTNAILGGGTDYFVRNPDPGKEFGPLRLRSRKAFQGIKRFGDPFNPWLEIGAATTAAEFFASLELKTAVPGIESFEPLFASSLVRSLATVGGNLANASPVGDLSSILLGIGAVLVLGDPGRATTVGRLVPLEDFFLGYKKTALEQGEAILAVRIPAAPGLRFSFAKIAKRGNLDIAAVNSALSFRIADGRIQGARMSLGGAAPIPLFMAGPASLIEGFDFEAAGPVALADLARSVSAAAAAEAKPISDARGSASYRSRMIERLTIYNFMHVFRESGIAEELFP